MSEEKTLGQILWETSQGVAMCDWSKLDDLLKADYEMRAQTIISEFLRRNRGREGASQVSKEKTLGQVFWDAHEDEIVRVLGNSEARESWQELEENDQRVIEIAAKAVISEFLRRNGEPVAFVDKDRHDQTHAVLMKELPVGTELFTTPQQELAALRKFSENIREELKRLQESLYSILW